MNGREKPRGRRAEKRSDDPVEEESEDFVAPLDKPHDFVRGDLPDDPVLAVALGDHDLNQISLLPDGEAEMAEVKGRQFLKALQCSVEVMAVLPDLETGQV
ncbi:hypothetical protein MASR2M79_23510 [Aminivibrio sp.]